ncbi:MAG: hypothetical protein ACM3MF_09205 [Anaerolineae bacterium]
MAVLIREQLVASVHPASSLLEAALDLFHAMNRAGIRYCLWKSNIRLTEGLRGQTDLDLLVDPEYAARFGEILRQYDVKPICAAPGRDFPTVENYLGFDEKTGKLFHLHVHYQLVLGEQLVKNHRLPLEGVFLDSAELLAGVKLPPPDLELIVLSLRILMKYRDRDVIKDLIQYPTAGISKPFMSEIAWLLSQTSMERVAARSAQLSYVLPASLITDFLTAATSDRHGRLTFQHLRQRARAALHPYQREGRAQALGRYFRELWRQRVERRFHETRGMTLPGAGLTIALIGSDGSGKTTLCGLLTKWLSWKMDVHAHYLGSKKPSMASSWLYTAYRLARKGRRGLAERLGQGSIPARLAARLEHALLFSHLLAVASDRHRSYVRGAAKARRGSIVIFDRFPYKAPLDGPEILLRAEGEQGALTRFFAAREEAVYRKFSPADYTIVLQVTPEVSNGRKPDHSLSTIRAKDACIQQLKSELRGKPASKWTIQDADLSLEDVLLQLKRKIWAAL